jgi:uncharacterized membrane protein
MVVAVGAISLAKEDVSLLLGNLVVCDITAALMYRRCAVKALRA